jgi:hypothetical protein
MFTLFLSWLRSQVRQAVLGGVDDAVAELTRDAEVAEAGDAGDQIANRLRQRLAALPGPAEALAADGLADSNGHGEPAKGRRKKTGD